MFNFNQAIMEKTTTRGIRNKNPFNIKRSRSSWKGKIKHPKDDTFEQFTSMRLGVRAGICLLVNAYIRKGFDTPKAIISRYAPASENDVDRYIDFVCAVDDLDPETKIVLCCPYEFYLLCKRICLYESGYDLDSTDFMNIVKEYHIF